MSSPPSSIGIRERLRKVVEDPSTPQGRVFALTIQGLIALSILAFATDTLPRKHPFLERGLHWIETVSVILFTIEYLLRLWISKSRIRFVFSFFGMIDLLAILPFYLALGVDLRSLRALRFLRLFRILKLARYSKAIQRFHVAFNIAKEEITLFLCGSFLILFLAAVGMHHFESSVNPQQFGSVFHSMWWAICTLTTVGYGDAVPQTNGGKIFASVVLLLGLGVVAVPAGLMASALSKARTLEDNENETQP